MWNGGWLYLDSHSEKLLKSIFFIKISIFANQRRYKGSLGNALRETFGIVDRVVLKEIGSRSLRGGGLELDKLKKKPTAPTKSAQNINEIILFRCATTVQLV